LVVQALRIKFFVFGIFFFLVACASDPPVPDGRRVRVSHELPSGDCRQIGQVIGSSPESSGAYEQALDDLKSEAARKTANTVRIVSISPHGTSIRGMAYRCR